MSAIPSYLLEAKTTQEMCNALAKLTGHEVRINSREALRWSFSLPKGYWPCQIMGQITDEQWDILLQYGVRVDNLYGTVHEVYVHHEFAYNVIAIRAPDNVELFNIAQRLRPAGHDTRVQMLKEFTDAQGVRCEWKVQDCYGAPSYYMVPYNCQNCQKPGEQGNWHTCDTCNVKMQNVFVKAMELLAMIGHVQNWYTAVGRSNVPYYLQFRNKDCK